MAKTLSNQRVMYSAMVLLVIVNTLCHINLCILSLINSVVFAWYLCILTGYFFQASDGNYMQAT